MLGLCAESAAPSGQDLHLVGLQLHWGLSAKHGNHHPTLFFSGFDLLHGAREAGQGTLRDLHGIAHMFLAFPALNT